MRCISQPFVTARVTRHAPSILFAHTNSVSVYLAFAECGCILQDRRAAAHAARAAAAAQKVAAQAAHKVRREGGTLGPPLIPFFVSHPLTHLREPSFLELRLFHTRVDLKKKSGPRRQFFP